MTHIKRSLRALLTISLCLFFLFSLTACDSLDTEKNDALAEDFVTNLVNGDYDSTYLLFMQPASQEEFNQYWEEVRPIVNGASSFEIERTAINTNATNGFKSCTTEYEVTLDNGTIASLCILTHDGEEGIGGIIFSDVTEFLSDTDAYVPTVNLVLRIVSILAFAFSVWMIVDCARRKMKRKWLWIILIFFGGSVAITFGNSFTIDFFIGLMFQSSKITAEAVDELVYFKLVVPVGAIVYFLLRRKLTNKIKESETHE